MTLLLPHSRHTEVVLPLEAAEDRASSERLTALIQQVADADRLRDQARRDADRRALRGADAVFKAALRQLEEEVRRHG
jgi:hypothetical protein